MESNTADVESSFKVQRIDYYFKQAKNLSLSEIERGNYTDELAKLLKSI
ncbi:hypothetical protein [Vibrio campbellii]|nr:hypothetical protein [Vibrio campbellii]UTZ44619.1 hypothetical protein HB764_25505 [Vibrio campbellii]